MNPLKRGLHLVACIVYKKQLGNENLRNHENSNPHLRVLSRGYGMQGFSPISPIEEEKLCLWNGLCFFPTPSSPLMYSTLLPAMVGL